MCVAAPFTPMCCLLALLASPASAADPLLIRSQSGQFVLQGLTVGQAAAATAAISRVDWVRLDPSVLAVSLERLKQSVLNELGLDDEWRGTIHVVLHPVRRDHEAIGVTSIRHPKGWNYRIELPEFAHKERLLQAVLQVLLMEIADRRSRDRQAELPPWLGEGLLAELQTTALATLTLEPQTSLVRHGQRRDPLIGPRECLRTNTPLTFDELSWPAPDGRAGSTAGLYQHCAHLFVHELLRLRNGRERLRDMLLRLHQVRNWQTAFLRAFEPHFPRLLDVDKWWSLAVVNLTGKDPFSLWPVAESQVGLDRILLTSVEVRVHSGELPVTTEAKLQQLISEWDLPRQLPALEQKLTQLAALRPRVVPQVAEFVDRYYLVLQTYLRDQAATGTRKPGPIKDAIKALDALDANWDRRRSLLSAGQASTGQ